MGNERADVGLSEIYNFLQISESLATAGMPTEDQLSLLKEAGYEVVINLALPNQPHALHDEAALVTDLGMEYISIPVVWEKPSRDDLTRLMDALDDRTGQQCFVHCMANYRVSSFIYLYRVLRLGVPQAEAEQQLRQIWQPNETWANFIDEQLARRAE
jgi:protein tyrosine phosphatase (PTP) superfamily phosphohydrolase (DUF442 family)